jgi:hypothetical protein
VVCVTRPVEPAYLDYLHSIGIGPQRRRVVPAGRELPNGLTKALADAPELLEAVADAIDAGTVVRISPFISGPRELVLARRLGRRLGRTVDVVAPPPALLRRCYRKDVMRQVAVKLGVPVPRGERVVRRGAGDLDALRDAVRRRSARTGRAIVRGVWGAAGFTTLVVNGRDPSFAEELRHFLAVTAERVFLVDEMLDARAAPNVQVWIDRGSEPTCFCVSDQRLQADTVHRGNTYPSRASLVPEMVLHAGALSAWLEARGYRGVAGFDFFEAEDPDTGVLTPYFAELNPRFNGATYPAALLDRLRRNHEGPTPAPEAFATAQAQVAVRSFREFASLCHDTLYTRAAGAGVVPLSVARLWQNMCTIAFVARTAEAAEAGLASALRSLGGTLVPLSGPDAQRAHAAQ